MPIGVATLIKAAAVSVTSAAEDAGQLTDKVTVEVTTTGSPTISVQIQGSIDNSDFVSVGSAVTSAGVTALSFSTTGALRYFKAALTESGSGTCTVKLGFLPGQ